MPGDNEFRISRETIDQFCLRQLNITQVPWQGNGGVFSAFLESP